MDPTTGGVAASLRNLLPVLDEMNIRSEVVCFDAPVPLSETQDNGFVLHRIGPATGFWGRLSGFSHWLDLNADNFDVIILHGLWLYNGYAYTKWIRRRRLQHGIRLPRSWVMPHGMLDPWFQQSSGRRFKSVRNFMYWSLIERNTIASADLLVFTSEAEREKAAQTFPGYKPPKTAVFQLGVPDPLDIISSVSHQQPDDGMDKKGFLLALGRIDPKKGFDLLPEVWRRLSLDPHYHDRLPRLLIAGPGWETAYGRKIKEDIAALALDNHISTVGMLEGVAKWHALRTCSALVMPSHQENFGLVAVEALACGTAVLISEKVDISPVIIKYEAGISDSDNEAGIEKMVRTWLDMSLEERQKMKVNARNLFLDQFEIRKTANRFKQLLEEKVI